MAAYTTQTKLLLITAAASLLLACQSTSQPSLLVNLDASLQRCVDLALEFRRDTSASNANNAAVSTLKSLPFLATNRFHSALGSSAKTSDQIEEWVQMSVSLGAQFRHYENRHLGTPWTENKMAQLDSCSQMFASSPRYGELRNTLVNGEVTVQDHYSALPQWLGFYPLLRPLFKTRIDKLHREEKRWFSEDQEFANPLVYGLSGQSTVAPYGLDEWFRQAYDSSPLGLPVLTGPQLTMLFELHAPQYEIDSQAERDKLGIPTFENGATAIDTAAPIAYTLPSYTRFAGANLLQLNYVVWFPEREPVSPVDLFAGKIDSLIWRVTLDTTGRVLLYDSVHSCGCYHKYFLASDKLRIRQAPLSEEPANIISLAELNPEQGLRLIISSNEHYVVGIEHLRPEADIEYTMANYSVLYALPSSGGSQSFFGPTGIIKGSERLERFTLWPTGIGSVGAMRQWGTHATGFVDRQHFDDATLFDNYLILD
jgi:hypothetical protein